MAHRPQPIAPFGAALAAALAALVAIAYRDALHAWFAADDFHWLEISTPGDVLASFFGGWGHGPAYRPIARLSFLLDRLVFGLDARGWHAHGLALLVVDGTLLGALLARLGADRVLAASAAAIFVLLPSGYENTIWISGRIHPLGLAFALVALLALDRHLESPSRWRLMGMAASAALALLTYEATLYVVPFAAAIGLVRWRQGGRLRDAVVAVAVLVALAAAYLLVRWLAVGTATLYATRRPSDLLGAGFASQAWMAALTLAGPLYDVRWPLAVAGVATAVVAPRLLGVVGLGAAVAAIAYAPFALAVGNAPRFVFGSGLGVAIAVGAMIAGLARVPRVGLTAAAIVALLVGDDLRREDEAIAHEWKVAGDVGRRVVEGIATASLGASGGDGPMYVLGPPAMLGRAMVFFNYFDAAVRIFAPAAPGPAIAIGGRDRACMAARLSRRDRRSRRDGGDPPARRLSRAEVRRILPECRLRAFRRRLPAAGDLVLAVEPRTFDVRRVDRARVVEWLRAVPGATPAARWRPPPGSG